MENRILLTDEALWKNWIPRLWIPGLALPILPWTRPFLGLMGLPKEIVLQPQVWEPIYHQAIKEYEQLMKPVEKLGGDEYTLAEMKVTQKVLTPAFRELANQLGKNTAVALERWGRRHLLNYEIDNAMCAWRYVLREACWPPNSSPEHISPPDCLEPLLAEIQELVYDGLDAADYLSVDTHETSTDNGRRRKRSPSICLD
jgi:hypothetical protein